MRFAATVAVALAFLVALPALGADPEESRVDQVFAAYDKPDSPGCALGVIKNGSFVYRKGYGAASLELGVPLTAQSVFYMGSVSKQFTAACVVLAAEQGYLALDDSIRKHIPELPDYSQPITLRQMLHHTSGFRDVLTLLEISGRSAHDLHSKAELIDLIARQKALNYHPGEEFLYSNTNYLLLAEVVERATKKTLSEFAAEYIFQPLGMAHTRFYDDHTLVVPGRVPAYGPGRNGGFVVNWSTNYDSVGGGGLLSSVDDMLLWDRNFYENKLGKGTLLEELQTRGVLNSGKPIDYALGLKLGTYRGLPIVEHGGSLFGYQTAILRFPEQRFTVVCLSNFRNANPTGLARKVADLYLEQDLSPVTVAPPKAESVPVPDPGALAGKYWDRRDHSVLSFVAMEGNLVSRGQRLRPVGPNRFASASGASYVFVSSDGVMKATIERDGETVFSGTRILELQLGDAALAAYVGTYKSTELDATCKLWIEKGSLMSRTGWSPASRLNPTVHDEFDADGMTLVFRRDASDRISGFDVFAGRVRNVGFDSAN